jgi:acetoacetyl-CoA reductase
MTRKVALVTGAMGGLGTAICQALARDGFRVAANCLPEFPPAPEWLKAQKALDFDFFMAEADVTDEAACIRMAAKVTEALGPITVLVNNAGITRDKFFPKMDRAMWDAVIATNLTGLFNVTHAVSPGMAERGCGRIINMSSVSGVMGNAGQANYAAAKAGLLVFTRALALELAAKGVTVNAIAPGAIATDMVMAVREDVRERLRLSIPVQRFGRPEEIGALVAYLASDLAGFITGATLNINGGMHMA